jgi:hypothetical protein
LRSGRRLLLALSAAQPRQTSRLAAPQPAAPQHQQQAQLLLLSQKTARLLSRLAWRRARRSSPSRPCLLARWRLARSPRRQQPAAARSLVARQVAAVRQLVAMASSQMPRRRHWQQAMAQQQQQQQQQASGGRRASGALLRRAAATTPRRLAAPLLTTTSARSRSVP